MLLYMLLRKWMWGRIITYLVICFCGRKAALELNPNKSAESVYYSETLLEQYLLIRWRAINVILRAGPVRSKGPHLNLQMWTLDARFSESLFVVNIFSSCSSLDVSYVTPSGAEVIYLNYPIYSGKYVFYGTGNRFLISWIIIQYLFFALGLLTYNTELLPPPCKPSFYAFTY